MIQLVEVASGCLGKGNSVASNGLRDGNVILDEQIIHTRFCTGEDDVTIASEDCVVEMHFLGFVQVLLCEFRWVLFCEGTFSEFVSKNTVVKLVVD